MVFIVLPVTLPKTEDNWLLADSIKPVLCIKFSNLVFAELK